MNILGILFLGYLFIYSSKSKSDNDTEETHTVDEPLCREILFRILNSCACELNILAPKSVLDLIPGNGQCNYVQNNVQFYRYIIRPATGSELTYEEIKNIINLKLNQRLRNGYPNMANTYYKKTLCLYCSDVDIDAYNEYYLYIDILPIVDKTSYQYYEQLQKYNHKKALVNDSIGEIYDKDF